MDSEYRCSNPRCRMNTHQVNDEFCARCKRALQRRELEQNPAIVRVLAELNQSTDGLSAELKLFVERAFLDSDLHGAVQGFEIWHRNVVERSQAYALLNMLPSDVRNCLVKPLKEVVDKIKKIISVLELVE